jgi:hypothetical protein
MAERWFRFGTQPLRSRWNSTMRATPRPCLIEMNMVGGRGGTRTLLAKREPPCLTVAG